MAGTRGPTHEGGLGPETKGRDGWKPSAWTCTKPSGGAAVRERLALGTVPLTPPQPHTALLDSLTPGLQLEGEGRQGMKNVSSTSAVTPEEHRPRPLFRFRSPAALPWGPAIGGRTGWGGWQGWGAWSKQQLWGRPKAGKQLLT